MHQSLRLGKILGVPVGLHYSWVFISLLVTISLATHYFPGVSSRWGTGVYWLLAVATSLLFFGSVLLHELAHSVVALARGIPVKSITLFIFGGVSQISREAPSPGEELGIAIVGPLTSLALAGVFWGIRQAGISPQVDSMAWLLSIINLQLAVFNMIPGFPLDGGRVFRSVVWKISGSYKVATRLAALVGQGVGYLFILGGVLWAFGAIPGLRQDLVGGLWIAFIGWFLQGAAATSYGQARLRDTLQGVRAQDLMSRDFALVSPNMTVRELVDHHVLPMSRRCVVAADAEELLLGLVTLKDIRKVPRERWDITLVREVMVSKEGLVLAAPADEAIGILDRMDEKDISQVPVVQDGKVLGMVGRDSVLHYLRTRSDLGV
ncbi:MAG: site-2 protease family protein [Dehalococcoidia bacterium]|nr:site-2 protease family protein [Dehalococcoidia bacterium]